ncbi:MAG: DUF4783 domain-containing protein [Prevotellaceae bacterium]|jgi:ABC-type uncharacterized transport system YnjBCD substrate-binding protein|nr:DUF4783 domain-containing protein [Prevotellaceae bacterium]
MKILKILTISCLLFSLAASAQDSDKAMNDALTKICSCVKEGNATCIGAYFGTSVSLDLMGSENMYGKEQAMQVLKDFFSKYKAKNFSTPHKGGQQVKYVVGTLLTHGGESFRVSIFVKPNGGKAQVQRIIIEKE